jgi:hypothetical protein
MNKPNFRIVRVASEPTPEQIAQARDFQNVLQRYAQQPNATSPLRRKLWWGAGIVAVVVVSMVVLSQTTSVFDGVFGSRRNGPPLALHRLPSTTFTIDATRGDTVLLTDGTRLLIPANSLLNADGDPANGPATVQYTRINDPADMLLAGIPMQTNGVQLESAGMFDLRATDATDRPLSVRPGSKLGVELPVRFTSPDTRLYELDTVVNTWQERGTPTMATRFRFAWGYPGYPMDTSAADSAIGTYVPSDSQDMEYYPAPPPLYDQAQWQDSVADDPLAQMSQYSQNEFTETDNRNHPLSGTVWQLDNMTSQDSLRLFGGYFDDVSFTDDGAIRLSIGSENADSTGIHIIRSALIYPEVPVEQLIQQQKQFSKRRVQQIAEQLRRNEILDSLARQYEFTRKISSRLMYNFQISGFGIWNCDRPIQPSETVYNIKFTLPVYGRNQRVLEAFSVESGVNSLFYLIPEFNLESFKLRTQHVDSLLVWVLLDNGDVGKVDVQQLRRLKTGVENKVELILSRMPNSDSESEFDELRKFLGVSAAISRDPEVFEEINVAQQPSTVTDTTPQNVYRISPRGQSLVEYNEHSAPLTGTIVPFEWLFNWPEPEHTVRIVLPSLPR